MIEIILSDKGYENDVYPLVKAFYPEESIKVYSITEYELARQSSEESALKSVGIFGKDNNLQRIKIDFQTEIIELAFIMRDNDQSIDQLTLSDGIVKAVYKNALKRFLYQKLSRLTGRELPWGILTGIRPTKLVYEQLEQGAAEPDIYHRMRDEYLCSDEKIAMSLEIAGRELQLLKEFKYQEGYSLYIGIPFCPSTCLYCSFTSYSAEKYSDYIERYLAALEKEIRSFADCLPGKKLNTVYLGGGTPTTLSAEQLDQLLSLVKEQFDFTEVREFCVEAGRPDSITVDKLMVLKKWGVDRISINPQSMQQKTLDLIGRKHSIEQVKEAFCLARSTGHDNINMDIIIGLPGENPQDVADTLSQIQELNPESLTVHTLAIKRAARLNTEKENYADYKATEVPKMLEQAIQFAKDNDYLPYYLYRQKNMADNLENIGYSRYGREGLYNILIMEEKQTILALGAGGMSKFVFHKENRLERVDNVKSVLDYINRIDEMIARKKNFIKDNLSEL
jgi:oxygen-independent coproporphyrinogen-3 oxidase